MHSKETTQLGMEQSDRQSEFKRTGVYQLGDSNTVYLDPVRMLNRSYSRFRVSASAYYPRFFTLQNPSSSIGSKKRKRKQNRKFKPLNQRELNAEQRHQEVRPILFKAHEALLGDETILDAIRNLRNDDYEGDEERWRELTQFTDGDEVSLVELGSVWQSQFYEITVTVDGEEEEEENVAQNGGPSIVRHLLRRSVQLFNNMIANERSHEMKAEFLDNKYIIPKQSCFYMSDLEHMRNLIPAKSDLGYNLIVIDPPWENSSAHQKLRYQTLPNRYFLSIPIKQLTHTAGALVALWVTNREKLRSFVENELFSAWGVKHMANFYWLKVKADGSLIGDMDLFHHRPYECLILGYCGRKDSEVSTLKSIPDNKVFVSVPGEYSRKPPLGDLLYVFTSQKGRGETLRKQHRSITFGGVSVLFWLMNFASTSVSWHSRVAQGVCTWIGFCSLY